MRPGSCRRSIIWLVALSPIVHEPKSVAWFCVCYRGLPVPESLFCRVPFPDCLLRCTQLKICGRGVPSVSHDVTRTEVWDGSNYFLCRNVRINMRLHATLRAFLINLSNPWPASTLFRDVLIILVWDETLMQRIGKWNCDDKEHQPRGELRKPCS